MSKRQGMVMVLGSNIAVLMIFFIGQVLAATPLNSAEWQGTVDSFRYLGVLALAFMPLSPGAIYIKDPNQQLLTLAGQSRNFTADNNRFIAPLTLPDHTRLTGLTFYGQDFDNAGEVWLRVKRCAHQQSSCAVLAEATSDYNYNAGSFEKVALLSESIDNGLYTYFLELELTALANSGLRSVRLELVNDEVVTIEPVAAIKWSLADLNTNFPITSGNLQRLVRVCADNLNHLPNPTHYPVVVVDGQAQMLASQACVDVSGYNIELRRQLNTGPSSGTYQFLR
ncbi:MAG: hypothetical protein U0401_31765 [Anaerolineae bacterium]